MHHPEENGSNVHRLRSSSNDKHQGGDVLSTLLESLKQASVKPPADEVSIPARGRQRIEGSGNVQLSGETASEQAICGDNNIQIGAVQLVLQVTMTVTR